MPTIVTYTDTQPPLNQFPQRIISPTCSGPCCLSAMEDLGRIRREERWEYAYRRCRTCGFTVREIVRSLPDNEQKERVAKLQQVFAKALKLMP
jgi:hypothetical protein